MVIWSKKPDKVKRNVLINDKCKGDLNMIDVMSLATSFIKCKWMKLYLDENESLWKVLFDESLRNMEKGFYLNVISI